MRWNDRTKQQNNYKNRLQHTHFHRNIVRGSRQKGRELGAEGGGRILKTARYIRFQKLSDISAPIESVNFVL